MSDWLLFLRRKTVRTASAQALRQDGNRAAAAQLAPRHRLLPPWRGLALGTIGVILLSAVTPYNDFKLRSTSLYSNYLPIGCLFLYALLVLGLNPLLRRYRPHAALQPGELLLAWAMWISGAGLAASGLWRYLTPIVVAPAYYAHSGSRWIDALQSAPDWLLLSKDPQSRSVMWFYQGIPPGQAIPWAAWTGVLLGWGVAVACITALAVGLCALFRKQWVVHERLTYPMAQLPLQLVVEMQSKRPLIQSRLFWIGCATVILCHGLSTAHRFAPAFPGFPDQIPLTGLFQTRPWNALSLEPLQILFAVIGATYLIPSDVSLTLWVTYVGLRLLRVARVGAGMDPLAHGPLDQEGGIAAGAAIFWTVWLFWIARPHWREVWLAFRRPRQVDESAEPLPSRASLALFVVGFLGMWGWLHAAGIPLTLGLAFLLVFCVLLLILTRMMAESGLLYLDTAYTPTQVMAVFGTHGYTPFTACVTMVPEVALIQDPSSHPMPAIANAFALTDAAQMNPRAFSGGVGLATLLGYWVAGAASIWLAYRYGAITLASYAVNEAPHDFLDRALSYAESPRPLSASSLGSMVTGGLLAALFLNLKVRFLWWPFGPIGLVMGGTWALGQIYFSLIIGWACKAAAVRFWGLRGYRTALPYFLGLLLGDGLFGGGAALWGLFTGVSSQVFLPQ